MSVSQANNVLELFSEVRQRQAPPQPRSSGAQLYAADAQGVYFCVDGSLSEHRILPCHTTSSSSSSNSLVRVPVRSCVIPHPLGGTEPVSLACVAHTWLGGVVLPTLVTQRQDVLQVHVLQGQPSLGLGNSTAAAATGTGALNNGCSSTLRLVQTVQLETPVEGHCLLADGPMLAWTSAPDSLWLCSPLLPSTYNNTIAVTSNTAAGAAGSGAPWGLLELQLDPGDLLQLVEAAVSSQQAAVSPTSPITHLLGQLTASGSWLLLGCELEGSCLHLRLLLPVIQADTGKSRPSSAAYTATRAAGDAAGTAAAAPEGVAAVVCGAVFHLQAQQLRITWAHTVAGSPPTCACWCRQPQQAVVPGNAPKPGPLQPEAYGEGRLLVGAWDGTVHMVVTPKQQQQQQRQQQQWVQSSWSALCASAALHVMQAVLPGPVLQLELLQRMAVAGRALGPVVAAVCGSQQQAPASSNWPRHQPSVVGSRAAVGLVPSSMLLLSCTDLAPLMVVPGVDEMVVPWQPGGLLCPGPCWLGEGQQEQQAHHPTSAAAAPPERSTSSTLCAAALLLLAPDAGEARRDLSSSSSRTWACPQLERAQDAGPAWLWDSAGYGGDKRQQQQQWTCPAVLLLASSPPPAAAAEGAAGVPVNIDRPRGSSAAMQQLLRFTQARWQQECISLARLHARVKQQEVQLQAAEGKLCQAAANTWQSSSAEQYCPSIAKVDSQQGQAVFQALQELMRCADRTQPAAAGPIALQVQGGGAAAAAQDESQQQQQQGRLQCQVELVQWEASEHAGGLSILATARPVLSLAAHNRHTARDSGCSGRHQPQEQQGLLDTTHPVSQPQTWQGPQVRVCYAQLLLVAPHGSPVVACSSWSWDAAQGLLHVQATVGPEQLQQLLLRPEPQPKRGVEWGHGQQQQQQDGQQQEEGEGMAGTLLAVAQSMREAAAAAAEGVQWHPRTSRSCSSRQLQAVLVLSARCDAVVAAASTCNASLEVEAPTGVASHRQSSHRPSSAQGLLTPATVMVCLGDVPWAPETHQQRLQALLQGPACAVTHSQPAQPSTAASSPPRTPVHAGGGAGAAAAAAAVQQADMYAVPPTPDSMQIEDVVVADTPDADTYEGAEVGQSTRPAAAGHPFEPLPPAGVQVAAPPAPTATSSSSRRQVCTCPSRAWTQPLVLELLLEGNHRHLELLPRLLLDSGFQPTACSSCSRASGDMAQHQLLRSMSFAGSAAATAATGAAAAAARCGAGVVLVLGGAGGPCGEVHLQLLPRGRHLEVQLKAAGHAALLQLRGALEAVLQMMQAATGEAITCGPNPACQTAIARYMAAADALSEAVTLHAAAAAETLYSTHQQQQQLLPTGGKASGAHSKPAGPAAAAAAPNGSNGTAAAANGTKRGRDALDEDDVQAGQDQDAAAAAVTMQLSQQLQQMWLSAMSAAAQLDMAIAHL